MKKYIAGMLFAGVLFSACRKKDLPTTTPPPVNKDTASTGMMRLEFDPVAGNEPLELNRERPYTAPDGEQYTVKKFNYYLSNFVFVDSAGGRFAEPESYHLVRSSEPASQSFIISGLPKGKYVSVEFLIGVDSARNVSGVQAGALSPDLDMFWGWKTGYIMGKMEGNFLPDNLSLAYHIAGFSGWLSVLQVVKVSLADAHVAGNKITALRFTADLNKWFTQPAFPGFKDMPIVTTTGFDAAAIASNYRNMFTLQSVENP